MKDISLGVKLLALLGLLLLTTFLLLAFFFSRNMHQDFVAEAKRRAKNGLNAVEWLLERQRFADEKALQNWVAELGKRLGVRITCIQKGTVVADSEVAFARLETMDDHSTRPEVIQAHEQEIGSSTRYSRTLHRELLYAAATVQAFGNMEGGVLRLAIPISDIQNRYQAVINRIMGFMLLAFCLAGLLMALILRRMSRSIQAFSKTAQQIGNGDYSRRISHMPGREFSPLQHAVNNMAESIQRHIRSLEDAKGELEALFDGMASGVMILGQDGAIESWNRALTEMFPDMNNARGMSVLEATMHPELQKMANSLLQSPQGTERMTTLINTREKKYLQAVLVPYRSPKGVRNIVIVFQDITETRRLERMRHDFMVNITHEIRTPVTSIQGYAETLLDSSDIEEKKRRQFIQTILDNAVQMGEMVKRLLSLARLDEDTPPKTEAVNLKQSLQLVLRTLAPLAEKRSCSILDQLPEPSPMVLATRSGLFEVLMNLLENAVVHGPEQGVITVTAETRGKRVDLRINDQGSGIPAFLRERIFERFFRADASRTDGKGHYGLGLAICRQLVRSFGADICVDAGMHDGQNSGTTFLVTLKLADEA